MRRAIDAGVQRQAKRDAGVIPPMPPHFDVRTPEYVVFDDVQRKPWECVRGMDQSFGYNASSRPEHFLARDELLWMLTDIVAKGGNLLLNVGPRGVDAQIPDEQLTRLDWLADWVRAARRARSPATRPWVTPGTTTLDGPAACATPRATTPCTRSCRTATGSITLPDVGPRRRRRSRPSTEPRCRGRTRPPASWSTPDSGGFSRPDGPRARTGRGASRTG